MPPASRRGRGGNVRVLAAGVALCTDARLDRLEVALQLTGLDPITEQMLQSGQRPAPSPVHRLQPFVELSKMVAAALIGALVTAIHQPVSRDRPKSLEQAQSLLCVSGAMMMIIIGNSLARAFGIAGAAGIVRFRTPVDDPKDVTILFLLMGLGMADRPGRLRGRRASAPPFSASRCSSWTAWPPRRPGSWRSRSPPPAGVFPTAHVEGVLVRNQIVFEPREISQHKNDISVKYHAWLDPRASLDDLSAQLMSEGSGVEGVSWDPVKREKE